MPDTDNKNSPPPPTNTPPLPPTDNAQYVTLARPQSSALFSEQRVEFKGDEVKQVVTKRELGEILKPEDRDKTVLADAAKELVTAGRLIYCTKHGKVIEPEKKDDK